MKIITYFKIKIKWILNWYGGYLLLKYQHIMTDGHVATGVVLSLLTFIFTDLLVSDSILRLT